MSGEIESDLANVANIRRLLDSMRNFGGLVPFVGAGFSVPFKFRGWPEFLEFAAQEAGFGDRLMPDIAAKRLEAVAQVTEAKLTPLGFATLIRREFGRDIRFDEKPEAPVWLLPQFARGPVITTNFDHVLENSYRADGSAFEMILWGAKIRLALQNFSTGSRFLLKLHGDAHDLTDRILTSQEYDDSYGRDDKVDLEKPLPKLLYKIFSTRPVLFLGCRLESDRTLWVLKETIRAIQNTSHFALVQRGGSPAQTKEISERLSECGISPIWFAHGNFDSIPQFLQFLAREMELFFPKMKTNRDQINQENPRERERVLNERETEIRNEWEALHSASDRADFIRRYNSDLLQNFPMRLLEWGEALVGTTEALDREDLLHVFVLMCRAALDLGDAARAENILGRARRVANEVNPGASEAELNYYLAIAYRRMKQFQLANDAAGNCLRILMSSPTKDLFMLRITYHLQAQILLDLKKPQDARPHLAAALRITRRDKTSTEPNRYFRELAEHLTVVSGLHFDTNNFKRMERSSNLAIKYMSKVPWRSKADFATLVTLYANLGSALHEVSSLEAKAKYLKALYIANDGGLPDKTKSDIHSNLAWLNYELAMKEFNPRRKKNLLAGALEHFGQVHNFAGEDLSLQMYAKTHKAVCNIYLKDERTALRNLVAALRFFRRSNDANGLALALNNFALLLHMQRGKPKAAMRAYKAAEMKALSVNNLLLLPTIRANVALLKEDYPSSIFF
jgi:hypothetical protein